MWLTEHVPTSEQNVAEELTGDKVVPKPSYSLGELSDASGASERTIRYYQNERLLPKPDKQGRDGIYRDDHVERLRLINELRDRGLSLHTIRELVVNDNPARTVSAWLGVDATLSAPWSDDRPRTLTQDELRATVANTEAGVIGELQDARYAHRNHDGSWDVPSPALLDLALQLRAAGVDIEIAGRIRDLLRGRLSKAVEDTVKLLVDRAGSGFAGAASAEELATALGALRPIAREMSSLILAQEVERALHELVESRPFGNNRSGRH